MTATIAKNRTLPRTSTVSALGASVGVPISADELDQRVAILRRFRELLLKQRERFSNYLVTLEKQETVIESGSPDELIAQVELEEQIVADIFSIQKVIDPLENMYQAAIPFSTEDDIPALKITLESLKNQAAARSAHNRGLLSTRMAAIRAEITTLRNNPFANVSRSMYQNSVSASLIDIQG
ncbi:MAG: flagellar biosynthesis protein FlgN [Treponema sp.]|jgi:hypothetical protein|nr:flagellar biosynthesis protein FlgN [Treponema sp.]